MVRFIAIGGLAVKLVGGQWFIIVFLLGVRVLAPASRRVVDRRVEYGFLPV